MSVDPADASALPSRPQTWNRYAYALNSPLKFFDPSGREWRSFAQKIAGLEVVLDYLAARSDSVRDTLSRYEGDGAPDLIFESANIGSGNRNMGDAGHFFAEIVPEHDWTKLDADKLTAGDDSELYPHSANAVIGGRLVAGHVRLDDGLKMNVKDTETLRAVLHELGHADHAVKRLLDYMKARAEDNPDRKKLHDDQYVEREAIQYANQGCRDAGCK